MGSVLAFDRKRVPRTRFFGAAIPTHQSIYNYASIVRHDSRTDFSCSGLPLVNLDGELIGLSTTIAGVEGLENGIGHVLPIDSNLRRTIETLRRGEEVEYGFLGVEWRDPGGIDSDIFVRITPHGPAAQAGLLSDDRAIYRIIRIEGQRVRSYEDLLFFAGSALAGGRIRLEVQRSDGSWPRQEVNVTLGKYRRDTPFIASSRPAATFGLRVDYGTILARGGFASAGVPPGVAVRELVPGSAAFNRFRALGETSQWLITHVNGSPTSNPGDFYRLTTGQASLKLSVLDLTTSARHSITLP